MNQDTIRNILWGCILAVVTALLVALLLPIPMASAFAILAVLILANILSKEPFLSGFKTAKGWLLFLFDVGIAFVIFILIRVIATKIMGITPYASRTAWNAGDGIHAGIRAFFWGDPTLGLLWEALFVIITSGVMVAWVKGHKRTRVAVAAFLVAALIVVTVRVGAPETAQELFGDFNDRSIAGAVKEMKQKAVNSMTATPQQQRDGATRSSSGGRSQRGTSAVAPAITLECGSGYSNALQPLYDDGSRLVEVTVKGDGTCSTPILVRPLRSADGFFEAAYRGRSSDFALRPQATVHVRAYFPHGTREYDDDPVTGHNIPDDVTGYQFRAPNQEPVLIRVLLE